MITCTVFQLVIICLAFHLNLSSSVFAFQPCIDNLYRTLVKEFCDTLSPVVIELMRQHQAAVDPQDLQAVLLKDAGKKRVLYLLVESTAYACR